MDKGQIYIKPGYEEVVKEPLPDREERQEYLKKAKGTKIKREEERP